MDFTVYILGILLTFGFGILTYQDKTYGIFGIIVGFIFAAFYAGDGSIVIAGTTYVPVKTGGTWFLLAIIQVVMVLLDFLIYNHVKITTYTNPRTETGEK